MNKSELKDLQIVVIHLHGGEQCYIKTGNILLRANGFLTLDSYKEDLTHYRQHTFDIVEVYELINPDKLVHLDMMFNINAEHHKLIWKRGE